MRRAEILNAAEGLFRHYGFQKTTVADIAREAGVGVGTVYLDFPSKDAILAALAQSSHDEALAAMEKVAFGNGNFSERLIQLLEARHEVLALRAEKGMHGRDLVAADCEEGRLVAQAALRRQGETLQKFLEEGNRAGAFGVIDAATSAALILQIYDSLFPTTRVFDEDSRQELATLHALILGGVIRRS